MAIRATVVAHAPISFSAAAWTRYPVGVPPLYQDCAAGILECREHDNDPACRRHRSADGRVHGAWLYLQKRNNRQPFSACHHPAGPGARLRHHTDPSRHERPTPLATGLPLPRRRRPGEQCGAARHQAAGAELAAIPESYVTARTCLARNLALKPGQTALVRGATSASAGRQSTSRRTPARTSLRRPATPVASRPCSRSARARR